MPEGESPPLCKYSRQVQYALNRVEEARRKYQKSPNSDGLKDNLIRKKENYSLACKVACEQIIERDIEKMRKDQKVNTRRFFAATGMYLKFEGSAVYSDAEFIKNWMMLKRIMC